MLLKKCLLPFKWLKHDRVLSAILYSSDVISRLNRCGFRMASVKTLAELHKSKKMRRFYRNQNKISDIANHRRCYSSVLQRLRRHDHYRSIVIVYVSEPLSAWWATDLFRLMGSGGWNSGGHMPLP